MTQEKIYTTTSGYIMLLVVLVLPLIALLFLAQGITWLATLLGISWTLVLKGFFVNAPNESKVLLLLGEYQGTARKPGFHWANPFYTRNHVSLRARNLNGSTLKVNDKLGNPIEIAAVLVWQVQDTAKALLEVDDFGQYVVIQSEAAVRHLANTFPYDNIEEDVVGLTLRASTEQVNTLLEQELNERLARAGIYVIEARISHLAYAQEIAGAMLQRQQATAVVAARRQIVEGAVGMVEMALDRLSEKKIVDLDEERKAAMVSNLLVVLCGEKGTQPIVNTGTLHH